MSAGIWNVTVSGLTSCQSITAKQIEPIKCISASPSAVIVQNVANTPSIVQQSCIGASLTSVKVSSSESSTATVNLYSFVSPSTYTPIAGTSSYASGFWTFTPSSPIIAGTTIVATITDSTKCKTVSVYSNSVILTTAPSIGVATTVTGPVFENSTTVSGTGVNGEWIQLYVDGLIPFLDLAETSPVGRVQVAGSSWSVTVNSNSIYLGAVMKVTASTASIGGCESALSASSVTVSCVAPTLQTYTGGSKSYCFGQTGSITLNSSELGIIYQLVNSSGVSVGPSAVGTGSAINLFTNSLTANLTNVFVKAFKLLSPSNTRYSVIIRFKSHNFNALSIATQDAN